MNEKKLFDLVENLGVGLFDKLHILDSTSDEGDGYRIYHADGYCFDIIKEEIDDLESFIAEFGEINVGNAYYYYSDDLFDGFQKLSVKQAIEIIEKYIK